MSFHEVTFPEGISYGAKGGPGYFTQIIQTDGGREERIARRSVAQRRWTISKLRDMSDVQALIEFFVAREGAKNGFRFKDVYDFSTGAQAYRPNVYASDDVEIGVGDGTTTAFQLIKKYTNGGSTKTRTITKPVSGKILIAVNGSATTAFSLDTTTGVVTFTTAPASGHSITAGFEFDVPVRFSSDTDQLMDLDYSSFETGRLSAGLVEIIGSTQVNSDYNYGGAVDKAISANTTLSALEARFYSISASTAGLHVALPDRTNLPPGGEYFGINNSGSNSFDLKDDSGTTLLALAAGEAVQVWLAIDDAGNKLWYAF